MTEPSGSVSVAISAWLRAITEFISGDAPGARLREAGSGEG